MDYQIFCKWIILLCVCVCWQEQGAWLTAKVGFTLNNITGCTSITKNQKNRVGAVILCPSFIFFTSHHELCAFHPPLKPWCLTPPTQTLSTPPCVCSPASPHFTTSLSDYADLSEPPRKKDWVFWGGQVGDGGAGQRWPPTTTASEGRQQATGEEELAVLHAEPEENHKQPEHGAGWMQLQEPHQIAQPVLSDLLLIRQMFWWILSLLNPKQSSKILLAATLQIKTFFSSGEKTTNFLILNFWITVIALLFFSTLQYFYLKKTSFQGGLLYSSIFSQMCNTCMSCKWMRLINYPAVNVTFSVGCASLGVAVIPGGMCVWWQRACYVQSV